MTLFPSFPSYLISTRLHCYKISGQSSHLELLEIMPPKTFFEKETLCEQKAQLNMRFFKV